MSYSAKILKDSVAFDFGSPKGRARLTTLEVTLPRIVLAEFNTHRVFSRNSASSRAIPVEKRIKAVRDNMFVPEAFGKNQKGMQSEQNLDEEATNAARNAWVDIGLRCCDQAEEMAKIGVHKQWANRIIEPYSWHTIVVTSTEWDNFFNLRCHKDAQPEIRKAAELMQQLMQETIDSSEPQLLYEGDYHLPLVFEQDIYDAYEICRKQWGSPNELFVNEFLAKISCARCARVSYLTHDGKRSIEADLELFDRLAQGGHMSPMEHAAYVGNPEELLEKAFFKWDKKTQRFYPAMVGNFRSPWIQFRKTIIGEDVFRKQNQ